MKVTTALQRCFGADAMALVTRCGELGEERGEAVYLVGGLVRDLLLGLPSRDIDIVVVGDGMALAQALATGIGGELILHYAFQTARVDSPNGIRVDVATARYEEYPRPGQLPSVRAGRLDEDLRRRDFTINTMAIAVRPSEFGELQDPFEGRSDLEKGVIRILHPRSFSDDPTRVLRALRFALRFDYSLEAKTAAALEEAVRGDYLDGVSGDRVRREVQALFEEAPVEGPLLLHGRRVLRTIHRDLRPAQEPLEKLAAAVEWLRASAEDGACPGEAGTDPGAPWALVLAVAAIGLEPYSRWGLVESAAAVPPAGTEALSTVAALDGAGLVATSPARPVPSEGAAVPIGSPLHSPRTSISSLVSRVRKKRALPLLGRMYNPGRRSPNVSAVQPKMSRLSHTSVKRRKEISEISVRCSAFDE